jgi:hypothetical protein
MMSIEAFMVEVRDIMFGKVQSIAYDFVDDMFPALDAWEARSYRRRVRACTLTRSTNSS